MLSHRNVIHAARGHVAVLPQAEADERICFLPLCHVAERIAGAYLSLYTGTVLNFVENPETIPENVREIAPTVFLAVPRIWEKFYSAIMIRLKEATPLERRAYAAAIAIGQRVADRRIEGQADPARAAPRVLARAHAGPEQRAQADRRAPLQVDRSPPRRRSRPICCAGTWRSGSR